MRPSARQRPPARFRPAAIAAAFSTAVALAPMAQAAIPVAVDHSLRLPVSGHAASVVVGNPLIADVTVVDSTTLYITGKKFGATDVVVLDPLGRTVFASDIEVVNGAGHHVRVYRAGQVDELSCNPTCATPTPSAATNSATSVASTSPSAGSAPAAATAGAAVGALAGGALGNALGSIGPR